MTMTQEITTAAVALSLFTMGFVAQTNAGSHEARHGELSGKQVVFLVGEGFHDGETYIPMAYLVNRGAEVHVIGVEPVEHTAYNSDITAHVHKSVEDVTVADYDGMVIPGGRSPDWLRDHEAVVTFAGAFYETGKPVAAICHGPQVLITAGVVDGVRATCFPGMSDELKEGGADYVDEPVVRAGNLITSRVPDDIPAFCAAFEEALLE